MRVQVTLDSLVTAAALLSLAVLLLTSFYKIYITVENGLRASHLKYLSRVVEDRMLSCDVVDGTRIYAPYDVNILCSKGLICWRDICTEVRCEGGGEGKTFVVRGCKILPVE